MKLKQTLLTGAMVLACSLAQAVTLRVSNLGDVQSMDPHSLNETLQLSFTASVYEALIGRDKTMALTPLLATKWTQTKPTIWRFELRKGVKFHDGTPFTADDVVFSYKRAAGDGSDMRGYTSTFKEVRRIDEHTVEIETAAPYPILPDVLSNVAIMNKKWCEDNKAQTPVDRRKGIENTASFSRRCALFLFATSATGIRSRATSTTSFSRRSPTTRRVSPRCCRVKPT
jgi:peptide/nickel transport system substrate-binding protein